MLEVANTAREALGTYYRVVIKMMYRRECQERQTRSRKFLREMTATCVSLSCYVLPVVV